MSNTTCYRCCSTIDFSASKCPYCQSELALNGRNPNATGGGVLFAIAIIGFLAWWLWSKASTYQDLSAPYYYVGWLFYHILIVPANKVFSIGGLIYEFFNNGLTPWKNMNFVLTAVALGCYWLIVAFCAFFLSLLFYLPLLLLSGIVLSIWLCASWLFS